MKPEHEETLDAVQSIRETIRDLIQRAEQQNATLRLSAEIDFLSPIPSEPDDELARRRKPFENPSDPEG